MYSGFEEQEKQKSLTKDDGVRACHVSKQSIIYLDVGFIDIN